MTSRVVFNKNFSSAELLTTAHEWFQDVKEATKSDYLPHNQLTLTNTDTSQKLYIYLDIFKDDESPDYTVNPEETMHIGHKEGITFRNVIVKNIGSGTIAADGVKVKIQTVRDV